MERDKKAIPGKVGTISAWNEPKRAFREMSGIPADKRTIWELLDADTRRFITAFEKGSIIKIEIKGRLWEK